MRRVALLHRRPLLAFCEGCGTGATEKPGQQRRRTRRKAVVGVVGVVVRYRLVERGDTAGGEQLGKVGVVSPRAACPDNHGEQAAGVGDRHLEVARREHRLSLGLLAEEGGEGLGGVVEPTVLEPELVGDLSHDRGGGGEGVDVEVIVLVAKQSIIATPPAMWT